MASAIWFSSLGLSVLPDPTAALCLAARLAALLFAVAGSGARSVSDPSLLGEWVRVPMLRAGGFVLVFRCGRLTGPCELCM